MSTVKKGLATTAEKNTIEFDEPKQRKVRSDKGKGRSQYIRKNFQESSNNVVKSFGFKTKKLKVELSKYERAVLAVITENSHLVSAMGDGSLPFILGILISRYSLTFVNEAGLIRSRLVRATLNHLEQLNLLKLSVTDKFPFGTGKIQLI